MKAESVIEVCRDAKDTCQEAAKHCDNFKAQCKEALSAADRYISLQDQKIKLQEDALANARQGYEYYKQKSEAWYRKPEFLIPVGLIAGFLIAEKVR